MEKVHTLNNGKLENSLFKNFQKFSVPIEKDYMYLWGITNWRFLIPVFINNLIHCWLANLKYFLIIQMIHFGTCLKIFPHFLFKMIEFSEREQISLLMMRDGMISKEIIYKSCDYSMKLFAMKIIESQRLL